MEIKKILFFKPGAIGDFLHTLPSLHALKTRFPKAHITVVVSSGQESLLHETQLAHRIEIYDKALFNKNTKQFLDYGIRLRRERYDLFVDMQSSVRSRVLRLLAGAKQTLVYRKQKRLRPRERRLHAVDNFMATIEALGINSSADHIDLPVAHESTAAIDRFLSERGINGTTPLVALNCSVGAGRPARNWVPERFGALADKLMEEGVSVVFIGGREDSDLVKDILGGMHGKALSTAGELSLANTAALLARCSCLVSSDTGPLHIATAVQTPVIGLYGSTDPRRTGPIGKNHIVVKKRLSCVPCEEKECPLGTRGCMTAISVEEVLNAVRKAIARK